VSLQDQTPPRGPDKRAVVFRHERRKRSACLPKPIDHAGLFRPPERKRVHTANRRDVLRTFGLDDCPRASYGSVALRLLWTVRQVKICPRFRVHQFRLAGQLYLMAYLVDERDKAVTLLALGGHENFYRGLKRYLAA
jgi:hypothetical protein